jgi:hypothetical protein
MQRTSTNMKKRRQTNSDSPASGYKKVKPNNRDEDELSLFERRRVNDAEVQSMRNKTPPELGNYQISTHYIQKSLKSVPPIEFTEVVPKLTDIDKLDNDCILYVLSFLPVTTLCHSLELVDHNWKNIVTDSFVWVLILNRMGISEYEITGKTAKQMYLVMCKERVLLRAEAMHAKQFTYLHFLSTCHPPNWTVKPIKIPNGSIADRWPRHPNQVTNIYNPNELVTNLSPIKDMISFYLKFEHAIQLSKYFDHDVEQKRKEIAELSLQRYIKFMKLKSKYSKHLLIPTQDIVTVWITHLLRPEKYESDCTKVFEFSDVPAIPATTNELCYTFQEEALKSTMDLWQNEYQEKYVLSTPKTSQQIEQERLRNIRLRFVADKYGRGSEKVEKRPYVFSEIPVTKTPSNSNSLSITADDILLDRQFFPRFQTMIGQFPNIYYTSSLESCVPVVMKGYERFMYLIAKNPSRAHEFYPTYAVDLVWHAHLLNPKLYQDYCMKYLGFVLSHDPTGLPSPQFADSIKNSWVSEFGEAM